MDRGVCGGPSPWHLKKSDTTEHKHLSRHVKKRQTCHCQKKLELPQVFTEAHGVPSGQGHRVSWEIWGSWLGGGLCGGAEHGQEWGSWPEDLAGVCVCHVTALTFNPADFLLSALGQIRARPQAGTRVLPADSAGTDGGQAKQRCDLGSVHHPPPSSVVRAGDGQLALSSEWGTPHCVCPRHTPTWPCPVGAPSSARLCCRAPSCPAPHSGR